MTFRPHDKVCFRFTHGKVRIPNQTMCTQNIPMHLWFCGHKNSRNSAAHLPFRKEIIKHFELCNPELTEWVLLLHNFYHSLLSKFNVFHGGWFRSYMKFHCVKLICTSQLWYYSSFLSFLGGVSYVHYYARLGAFCFLSFREIYYRFHCNRCRRHRCRCARDGELKQRARPIFGWSIPVCRCFIELMAFNAVWGAPQ